MIDNNLKQFIEAIPKAELHNHLDAVYPDLLLRLAERNNIDLPFTTIEEANAWYVFKDLEDFLQKLVISNSVLLTKEDYYDVAYEMGKDMMQQNILRREAMFTYAAGHEGRVELDVMLNGLARGRIAAKKDFDVDLFFIADIDRTISPDRSLKFIEDIIPYKDDIGIVGVGFDCQAIGYPAEPHKPAFRLARENGFYLTGHSGEEDAAGPEGVWDIIENIEPDRIDHGNQAIHDDKLVKHLVDTQIPLTLCPMSNVALHVYNDISEHPIIALRDKGVFVTLNSDDPSFMQNNLIDNYVRLTNAFDLSCDDIAELARNGFIASFASDDEKQNYLQQLDGWLSKNMK